jgi:hypothetical protein
MRKVVLGVAIAAVLGLSSVAAMAIHNGGDPTTQPNQVTREAHAHAVEARGDALLSHHESDRSSRRGTQDVRQGDDPSTHESGDDHGGAREAEPADDHGQHNEPEPADDGGGHGGHNDSSGRDG